METVKDRNSKIIAEIERDPFIPMGRKSYHSNELMFRIREIARHCKKTSSKIERNVVIERFNELLECNVYITTNMHDQLVFATVHKDKNQVVVVACLLDLALQRINLKNLENKNQILSGLNEFIHLKFPVIYRAYCMLSAELGFENIIIYKESECSAEY